MPVANQDDPASTLLLGIDVGTTSVKAGLFARSGETLALASLAYPTSRPRPGWVEQAPEDWLEALWQVVDRVLDGRALAQLAAVGVCSQVNTHVFVDAAGRALAPAIVWQDTRAVEDAEQLDATITADERSRWWNSTLAVSASHTLARMAWMRRTRPELWQRTARVLSPKDFVLHHLTGRWTADPLGSFDWVDREGLPVAPLIARVPGAAERLPRLFAYREPIGMASHPRFAGSKAVFVAGTMDGFSGLIGAGAARAGEGAYISGTSEIIALIGAQPGGAPGVVSFIPVDGWHVQAGPTQSGGDTLRWLAALLRQTPEAVLDAAATASRAEGSESLLFLPHLQGERAPLWDPLARGSFLGLAAASGMPELALAALEGVACSARLLFDAAQTAAGARFERLGLGGGGTRSDFWSQLRADVMGVPLARVECLDTGVVGAAVMAGVGAGLFTSVAEGAARLVRVERVFTPDAAMQPRYKRMMRRYVAAYEALKPVYRA